MENMDKLINEQRILYINRLFNSGEITYSECEYLKQILRSYNNLVTMKADLEYEDEITNLHRIYEIKHYIDSSSTILNKYRVLDIDEKYVKELNKTL